MLTKALKSNRESENKKRGEKEKAKKRREQAKFRVNFMIILCNYMYDINFFIHLFCDNVCQSVRLSVMGGREILANLADFVFF